MNRKRLKPSRDEAADMFALKSTGINTANAERDYIEFIRYCAEKLSKGDSIQVIWRDYLEKVAKR